MNYKEAREYLVPIAANCVLPQYAAALEKAMEALEKVERLEKEKAALLEDAKKWPVQTLPAKCAQTL